MGVFEDVVLNARSAASNVGKKAERLVDISKLRVNAAELNGDISKKYEALGRLVYDSVKAGATPEGLVEEYVESIDVLYLKLDEVNEKIDVLSKKSVCPICGAKNAEGALFCSHCGTKLKYNEQPAEKVPVEEVSAEAEAPIAEPEE